MIIRLCQPQDAAALMQLCEKLDAETSFMLFEPGERDTSVEEHRARLESMRASDHERMLVASAGDELAGFIAASRKPFKRVRHCFYLVIGVARNHWGCGVGRNLMESIEAWVASAGGRRIELTVVASNERAVELYKNHGFTIEGTRRNSMCIGGDYVDELYMGKWLEVVAAQQGAAADV